MTEDRSWSSLERLREDFDRSFTHPDDSEKPPTSAYLSLSAADRKILFRVRDAVGSMAHVPLTPIPSERRELMGLAQIRGAVVAVLDLNQLLGAPPMQMRDGVAPWAIVVRWGESEVALGVPEIHGLVWLQDDQVNPADVLQMDSLAI